MKKTSRFSYFSGFILLTALALGNLPIAFAAVSFQDVPATSKYYAAVEYLKLKGVISGYADGTFKPSQTINRAEALKVVLLAIQAKDKAAQSGGSTQQNTETQASAGAAKSPAFPDVKATDWFKDYVNQAYQLKIVEGYPDGTFKPENKINVAESLKIIFKSFQVTLHALPLNADPYADVKKDSWYAVYAQYGLDRQLITPQGDGKLHGEKAITRGDFADIVYRLLYVQEANIDKFPLSKDWPTYVHPDDHFSVKYPFDWQRIDAGVQTVFWKQDTENGQVSFARIYPNSGTVIMVVDKNASGLSLPQYLAKIQYDASSKIDTTSLNGYPFATVTIAATGLSDYYFLLPNKTILIVYSQIGSGTANTQLQEDVRYLVGSIRYSDQGGQSLKDQFLSGVRTDLLVSGNGKETMSKFTDLTLFDTDTIGVGTGPVDYFYSAFYDTTLKYERSSDTLLSMKQGKTSAF
ncbi:MAG: S-layer homology domain-containing protein [Candidatus Gracilibacteria bacterium]|jgi:hypothetical protein